MQKIIDSHMHIWDLSFGKFAWLCSPENESFLGDYSPLKQNYLIPDYRHDSRNFPIEKAVYVQAGWDSTDPIGEAKWISEINDGLFGAIISYANLTHESISQQLEELSQYSLVRGIRQIIAWHTNAFLRGTEQNYLENPLWRKHFALLEKHRFVFDMQIFPEQIDSAYKLIKNHPNIPVIIEHILQPIAYDTHTLKKWKKGLTKLAQLPNTFIKLSGMNLFVHDCAFTQFKQLFETCVEHFSTKRSMIGSNFPVEKLFLTFDQLFEQFMQVIAQYSAVEQNDLLYQTAKEVYRI